MEALRRALAAVTGLCALLALAPAAYAEPTNSEPPSVTGGSRPQDGVRLTADEGEWDAPGTAEVSFSYSWRRCSAAGTSCVPIPGATGRTYLPAAADVARRLRVRVTGNCAVPLVCRPTPRDSGPTGVVAPDPLNEGRPEITGTARRGETLSASTGFWRSPARLSFTYSWQRCGAGGGGCTAIAGATAPTYRLTAADEASTIRVAVTARNARPRAATAFSALTDVVSRTRQPTRRRALRLLSPFPTIVIAGLVDAFGADVSEFTVRGPRRALVTVRCLRRGCPFRVKRLRMRSRRQSVPALERRLRAGVVFTVTVTRRGYVGKHSRIAIRSSRAPARRDRCLKPGARRPSRCP